MKYLLRLLTLAAVTWTLPAQVKITKETGVVHVQIDGKAFGDLYTKSDVPKPYFAPLRSASGKIVTRQFPMAKDLGETDDHLHHRGMWLGYIDVNGITFWDNEYSYHKKNAGRILTRQVEIVRSAKQSSNALRGTFDWVDPTEKTLLTESRTMVFYSDPVLRTVDIDAKLTAVTEVVFGDDKDGAFAVRVADPLTELKGGMLISSAGGRGMKAVWGKPANWVDYSGTIAGEELGVAIMDHPTSLHYPARWHARDYGLLSSNPFATRAYDPAAPASSLKLKAGESVRLRYRVVIHPKMNADAIERLYKAWAAVK